MRLVALALMLVVSPPLTDAAAEEKATIEQVNASLASINETLGALDTPTRHLSIYEELSQQAIVDFVTRVRTGRQVGQRAVQSLDYIRDTGLLTQNSTPWNLRHVEQIRRNAKVHLDAANGSINATSTNLDRDLRREIDLIENLIAMPDRTRTWLGDSEANLTNSLEKLERVRGHYQRAVWIQEAFGGNASETRQVISIIDRVSENLPDIHRAAAEDGELPEAKSDDPAMMEAAATALAAWVKKYGADETGPIVLTSETIKEGSRTEAGIKAGGDTNTKMEVGTYRWKGFVFWVPVRRDEEWHLYRMVARNYTQAPDLKTGRWRVWNDGRMSKIQPSAWK